MAYTSRCSRCQRRAPMDLTTRLNDVPASAASSTNRSESDQDERPLDDVACDVAKHKFHVKPAVAQQMQHSVKEHEQAQHAAKTRQTPQWQSSRAVA